MSLLPHRCNWPQRGFRGEPLNHWENTAALLDSRGIVARYNQMAKRVDFSPAPYSELSADSFITELRGIAELEGYSISRADLSSHLLRIAGEYAYNPVADYLRGCLAAWDGQETHIRQKFNEFILDDGCDVEFLYNLFRRWVITAAKMPFNDGTVAAQGVLCLVGPQGIGKTRFLSSLLPVASWGKAGRKINPAGRDNILQTLSFWLVELGEYGRMLGKNGEAIKAFITNESDFIRRPYTRTAERYPRTTVFIATTDKDEFLKDTAGERRNWVIPIKGFREQNTDLAQFWGEAAHLALVENERHWLTMDEIAQLNRKNEAYKIRNAEFEILFPLFDWDAPREEWVYLTSSQVAQLYGLKNQRVGYVGRALTAMSVYGVQKSKQTSCRAYFVPPSKNPQLWGKMDWLASQNDCPEAINHQNGVQRNSCAVWITATLQKVGGEMPSAKLEENALAEGFSKATLRRAKDTLKADGKIKYIQRGNAADKAWYTLLQQADAEVEDYSKSRERGEAR